MQSTNKKSTNPARFIISSVTPQLRNALYTNNADKWGIEILDTHYLDLFPKENLVYLTGDTDSDLQELDTKYSSFNLLLIELIKKRYSSTFPFYKRSAYIIGGLVDHNRLKNVTLETATKQGTKVKKVNHLLLLIQKGLTVKRLPI